MEVKPAMTSPEAVRELESHRRPLFLMHFSPSLMLFRGKAQNCVRRGMENAHRTEKLLRFFSILTSHTAVNVFALPQEDLHL
jgi:hypothetical protein